MIRSYPIAVCGDRYRRCRIPGLAALPNGTLLACWEGRDGDSDWSHIDLCVSALSPETGAAAQKLLLSSPGHTLNNPTLIADGARVHLLYCEDYRRAFCVYSDDAGESWSEPTEITAAFEGIGRFFSVFAIGPGHGVRDRAGRLLVPVWFGCNASDPHAHHPSFISTLVSEDGGGSWRTGEAIDAPHLKDPSECCLAQLPDGTFYLLIRNENDERLRYCARSGDGVSGWSAPAPVPTLPDPVCQGGMTQRGDELLFVNCADRLHRSHLTLKASRDLFRSFRAWEIDPVGGYADVAVSGEKIFVFYEQGERCLRLAVIE